jgi:uncharacterized coiled-coil protein SlyX
VARPTAQRKMTDQVEPVIVADPDASTMKRPRRTKTLTTKAQENLQSDETTSRTTRRTGTKVTRTASISTDDGQDESRESNNNTDAGTIMLQKVFGVLRVLRDEFSKQQEVTRSVINDQQNTIQELEQQLQENQRELKHIREQLDTIMKCPAMTASTQTSPQASYAEMARTPPTSQPSNVWTLSTMNTTPSEFTDTLFCTIDKSRVDDSEGTKVTAGTVRGVVEREMRATKDNASWRCRAVTVDPKNTNRIKIACRDEEEHQMVKQVAEKTKLASGVRVLRDELYPIKVDSVKRAAVLDDNGEIRTGAAEAFGQENKTTIAKIA